MACMDSRDSSIENGKRKVEMGKLDSPLEETSHEMAGETELHTGGHVG